MKFFYYGDLAISFDINDKIIIENASIQTIIHPNFESISDTDLQEITSVCKKVLLENFPISYVEFKIKPIKNIPSKTPENAEWVFVVLKIF